MRKGKVCFMKKRMLLGWGAALLLVTVAEAQTGTKTNDKPNLVLNGSFDDPEDPLNHWVYVFDHSKHYLNNHTYVSVVKDPASTRQTVLRLDATVWDVCINQGVMAYTAPIRFDPKKKYKISFSACSVGEKGGRGPISRIYPIAYRWHPRAVKSNDPSFNDLREAVRFQVIYFNNAETGEFSNVPRQWKRVETTIPSSGRSELQQRHLENCEWLMLKFIALDGAGTPGYLYVDDVKIEEIGLADEVKITAGAATKGFDGKSWTDSSGQEKKFVPIGGPTPVKKSGATKKK